MRKWRCTKICLSSFSNSVYHPGPFYHLSFLKAKLSYIESRSVRKRKPSSLIYACLNCSIDLKLGMLIPVIERKQLYYHYQKVRLSIKIRMILSFKKQFCMQYIQLICLIFEIMIPTTIRHNIIIIAFL